jgi:hypothetical protein
MHTAIRFGFIAAVLAACTLVTMGSASAQTKVYQCKNDKGEMTMSDQPCGNVVSTKTYNLPDINTDFSTKPHWYRFLNRRCQEMGDSMDRSGFSRASLDVKRRMLSDYLQSCGTDIRRAMEDSNNDRSGYKAPVGVKSSRPPPEQTADEKSRELCAELGANLKQRRARMSASPTEAEKSDLKQFETRYEERCRRAQ